MSTINDKENDKVIPNPQPYFFKQHFLSFSRLLQNMTREMMPSKTDLGGGTPRWHKAHVCHTHAMRAKAIREGRRSFKVGRRVRRV